MHETDSKIERESYKRHNTGNVGETRTREQMLLHAPMDWAQNPSSISQLDLFVKREVRSNRII